MYVHWWLTDQRLVRVGLHCQARCDCHPWRQCSLYSLNLHLDNGGGSSHSCPPLECLKRWQSDHTCHHPHRFNELATKSENGIGSPNRNVLMVNVHLQKPCGCTALDMQEWRKTTELRDRRQSNPHKWLASQKSLSVKKFETLPAGTKPRTLHHQLTAGERCGKRKC